MPFISSGQYYFKGEIKNEKGVAVQNATIRLNSTGYIFYSGLEGGFGIPSTTRKDTLLISAAGYEKLVKPMVASEFMVCILKKAPPPEAQKLSSRVGNFTRQNTALSLSGDETYASTVENQFINTLSNPTNTLSLNSDRASYSNIRRFINQGSPVPPDAVRIEEMVHYFNLNYREPAGDTAFNFDTQLTNCPWNRNDQLLFINLSSKKLNLDQIPRAHLIFLVDVSGSMDMPNRLPLIKEAFKSLVNNLRPSDLISLVTYGGTTRLIFEARTGKEKDKIIQSLESLDANGATPGASGIELAYQVAKNNFIKGGNNRIILATDGDFNVGLKSEEELETLIKSHQHSGVYLSCLGMGMGNYKDSKIQTLAHWGNGNFAYLDSYAEAEKVLLKEFTQTLYSVGENAVLEVGFDPSLVKAYRLIGFDNKLGALKDSASVLQGGVIGPGSVYCVIYELVPTLASPPINQLQRRIQKLSLRLQYQPGPGRRSVTVSVKNQLSPSSLDRADSRYRFTCAVIEMGSMLRNSKYIKGISWNEIIEMAQRSMDSNFSSQKEFVSLVQKAKNIYGRKRKQKD
ncbi:MAG: VWA domain-containing protein [Flavisolibacter sp.]